MHKKKILFLTHYTQIYGANISLLGLINELKKHYDCYVLLPSFGEYNKILESNNIKYSVLKFEWILNIKLYKKRYDFFNLLNKYELLKKATQRKKFNKKQTKEILQQLDIEKFDLIYSNSSVIDFGYMLAEAYNIPHIFHIREYGDLDYRLHHDFSIQRLINMMNNSNATIFISNSLMNYYNSKKAINNAKLIYNGVLKKQVADELNNNKERNDETFNFVMIGAINKTKRQDFALKAFKIFIDKGGVGKLVFAGDGEIKKMKKLSSDLGVDKYVEFLGYVENPIDLLLQSDILLMCSKYEAFGRVTAEAMFCYCPVIGINSGGTPEIIDHNINGMLVNDDVQEFGKTMFFLHRNKDLLDKLIENGRNKALKNFTIEKNANDISDVIQESINKK